MNASWKRYTLHFKQPAGTSRGVLNNRDVWFLFIEKDGIIGSGECAPLPGLSLDNLSEIESALNKTCNLINSSGIDETDFIQYPSIGFAVEMALLDINTGGKKLLFKNMFTDGKTGIPINGLIWMGSVENMKNQIDDKIQSGFDVIKIKIGAIDFLDECALLEYIRSIYGEEIEIRLDANGAFSRDTALTNIITLQQFSIHSIEQPLPSGDWQGMSRLCQDSPIPIALDEELIGIHGLPEKVKLLNEIQPDYIILKPSLLGGFTKTQEWIQLASEHNIGWWITSALESNIGLNAIAQWTASLNSDMTQGLGTGHLYTNNISSPLSIQDGLMQSDPTKTWGKVPY